MRILHTADWHMNASLGTQDLSQDIVASLEQIAKYLESEKIDVMIVAGDVFCDRSSREQLRTAVGDIKRIFGPFLTRPKNPGTILAISGNHDNDVFFETMRNALDLAPAPTAVDGTLATGRMHLYHRPNLVKIADPNGVIVQFLLMPYPKEGWLRDLDYDGASDRNRMKQDRFTRYLQHELIEKKLEKSLPAVLVSHILVEGVQSRQGYRLGIEQDVAFAPGDIPAEFAYTAYGHIHQPQEVLPNTSWIRYCGSIVRLDAGECDDAKCVVVFEVGREGRIGEPKILEIKTAPVRFFKFDDGCDPDQAVSDLEAEWTGHADRERVLAQVRLPYTPGVHGYDGLNRRLKDLFPRLYQCDLVPLRVGAEARSGELGQIDLTDVAGNATRYVSAKMAKDERLADLLAALTGLLSGDDMSEAASSVTSVKQEAKI